MTLTIEKGISEGLKIQFINEIVVLHGFTRINTSKTTQSNVVNIVTSDHETLNLILSKINSVSLTVTVDNQDDTVILVH